MDEDAKTLQRLAEAVDHIDRLLAAQSPEQAIELAAELLLAVTGASGVVVFLLGPEGPSEHWAAGQLEGRGAERAELAAAAFEQDEPVVRESMTAIPLSAGVVRAVMVAQGGTEVEGEQATVLATLGSRGLDVATLRATCERQRQHRLILSRFLGPSLTISAARPEFERLIEPVQRPVSLMALDVDGLSEEVDLVGPVKLLPVIDQYFSTLVDTVYEHEGLFLEQGLDGAIAVFGAPISSNETTAADLAASAALRLLGRLREMTDAWGVEGLPLHLRARAGVSSGLAMTGAFGPSDRPLFSLMGPQMGLVRQLSQHGKPWDLVVDSSTRSLLAEHLTTRSVGALEVRGLDYPVFAYVAALPEKPEKPERPERPERPDKPKASEKSST